jgi:hypothetical protein
VRPKPHDDTSPRRTCVALTDSCAALPIRPASS